MLARLTSLTAFRGGEVEIVISDDGLQIHFAVDLI